MSVIKLPGQELKFHYHEFLEGLKVKTIKKKNENHIRLVGIVLQNLDFEGAWNYRTYKPAILSCD